MKPMRKFLVVLDNATEYIEVARCSMDVLIRALDRGASKIKVTAI